MVVLACLCVVPLQAVALETSAKQAIVVDDSTNTVLFEKNADEKMHPSSMTKLMTVYLTFKRLKEGSLKLTDQLPVSEKAWRMQGSKSFVELGSTIAVEDLLQGIIVQSGNDACVVIAESLAGSEDAFAGQMNDMAKSLGMKNTYFVNASGMPEEKHLMSARDLALLSHHIIHDFPEYYHYFSQKEYVHNGIKQGNRNLLLYKNSLVDGLKTGHTAEAGYGIAVSGKDASGRRIILVINGLESEKARAEEAERLLAFAFRDFERLGLVKKGQLVEHADVWMGAEKTVPLTVAEDFSVTLPKTNRDKLRFVVSYSVPLVAPVKAGLHVADLKIYNADATLATVPLVAGKEVVRLGGFSRMMFNLRHLVTGS